MKKAFYLLPWVLALAVTARAASITGTVAIAGLDTFNTTAVTFENPAVILLATGDFSVLGTVPQVDLHNLTLASAPGFTLWDWNHGGVDASFQIAALNLVEVLPNFLNVKGTADLSLTGFSPTIYDFAFTTTHSDDMASYTVNITPAAIPEPVPLVLLGTGIVFLAGLMRWRQTAS